jgi:hypothetical protein
MEAARFTETSVNIYQAMRLHIPGDTKRQGKFPYLTSPFLEQCKL